MAEGGRANESDKRAHGFNRHWFVKKEKALEYQCGVCRQILEDPVQIVGCGHQCCKLCLPDEAKVCPICYKVFKENEVFPDESVRLKVLALTIKCPAHRGCDWKGKLEEYLKQHTRDCKCELVNCTNKGCNQHIVKENLQTHVDKECDHRKVVCPHCQNAITFADQEDHLANICPRIPLDCTQKCTKRIPREEMEKHVKDECEMTEIDCVYKDVGCPDKIQRQHARDYEHESMQNHLRLAIAAINNANTEKQKMAEDIDKLINENDSLREELKDLSEAHEMRMVKIEESIKDIGDEGVRRLDGVQKGVEQNFESVTEQVKQNEEFQNTFLLMDNEIVRINNSVIPQLVDVYRSHEMSIRKLIVEDDRIRKLSVGIFRHFDKALKEAKNEMETKIDQLARRHENDYEKTMEFQEAAGREFERIDQAVEKNADNLTTQTQSLLVSKDATKEQFRNVSKQMERNYENLAEKISNEKHARQGSFQELTQEVARLKVTSISYGSFLWKIDNVNTALKMAAADPREAIYGQSFYSRPNGYLMRPKLFLNGARQRDRGRVSVFLQLLKSPNDALLQWPFGQRVRFTLVEQQEGARIREDIQRDLVPNVDSEETQRPTDEANNGYGIYNFVKHEVLLAGNYIADGTMFVRVEVCVGDQDEPHSETI